MTTRANRQAGIPTGRIRRRDAWVVPLLVVCVALPLTAGCGGSSPSKVVVTEYHEFTPDEQATRSQVSQARYRLHPGDVIDVDFKYQDELDKESILILPDGTFTLGGVDDINARGLTVSELDSTLTARFAVDYRNPELSVMVRKRGEQFVYVFGEVGKPGAISLVEPQMGLLQAVAMAGGFTDDASDSEVLVVRVAEDGYFYQIADISHLEKRDPLGLAQLMVQDNDIVYVPQSTLGDLRYFSDTFLNAALRVSSIFWDVYAITHLNKVDRLVR
jgi:polysaccharide export outer membrane protein